MVPVRLMVGQVKQTKRFCVLLTRLHFHGLSLSPALAV